MCYFVKFNTMNGLKYILRLIRGESPAHEGINRTK